MNTTPTQVEKRVWKDSWEGQFGPLADNPHMLEPFRSLLRRTAYHEAGHVAVLAFLDYTYHDVQFLTIIPHGTFNGMFRIRSIMTPDVCIILGAGCVLRSMMGSLGGWCAEQMISADPIAADQYMNDRHEELIATDGEWDWERDAPSLTTDEGKVWYLADGIASPTQPRDRIICRAVKWTFEVLGIPEVWQSVKTAADDLLARGTIRASARMDGIFRPGLCFKPPHRQKWSRRLPPPRCTP